MEPREAVKIADYIVLNCYRLADRFKCSPDTFLDKPFSLLGKALYRVDQLDEKDRIEAAWQEKLAETGGGRG